MSSLHAQTPDVIPPAGAPPTAAAGGVIGGAPCSGMDCLPPILQSTNNILAIVNSIPTYLSSTVTPFILNLKAADDTDQTANMQTSFVALGQTFGNNQTTQLALQQQLMANIVNQPISSFTSQGNNAASITALLPNINDLAYSSLLGAPPVMNKNQRYVPSSNFISYVGGANLTHVIPSKGWQGTEIDKTNYTNYYNTVIAVESFDNYVLSNLYVEATNDPSKNPTSLQNSLITQASSTDWISQIASEEIGKVLRQMLIFQSQSYVLLTQLLQTQKQLLTATAMTNTLLILNNRVNESYITSKAQGIAPRA